MKTLARLRDRAREDVIHAALGGIFWAVMIGLAIAYRHEISDGLRTWLASAPPIVVYPLGLTLLAIEWLNSLPLIVWAWLGTVLWLALKFSALSVALGSLQRQIRELNGRER